MKQHYSTDASLYQFERNRLFKINNAARQLLDHRHTPHCLKQVSARRTIELVRAVILIEKEGVVMKRSAVTDVFISSLLILSTSMSLTGRAFADDSEDDNNQLPKEPSLKVEVGAGGLASISSGASGAPGSDGGQVEVKFSVESRDNVSLFARGSLGGNSNKQVLGDAHLDMAVTTSPGFRFESSQGVTASPLVVDLQPSGMGVGYRSKNNHTSLILDPINYTFDRDNGAGASSGLRFRTAQDFEKIFTLEASVQAAILYDLGEGASTQTVKRDDGTFANIQTAPGLKQQGAGRHLAASLGMIFYLRGDRAYVKTEGIVENLAYKAVEKNLDGSTQNPHQVDKSSITGVLSAGAAF